MPAPAPASSAQPARLAAAPVAVQERPLRLSGSPPDDTVVTLTRVRHIFDVTSIFAVVLPGDPQDSDVAESVVRMRSSHRAESDADGTKMTIVRHRAQYIERELPGGQKVYIVYTESVSESALPQRFDQVVSEVRLTTDDTGVDAWWFTTSDVLVFADLRLAEDAVVALNTKNPYNEDEPEID